MRRYTFLNERFGHHHLNALEAFFFFIEMEYGPPRGFGDLGRMAIYFQGAGEHW